VKLLCKLFFIPLLESVLMGIHLVSLRFTYKNPPGLREKKKKRGGKKKKTPKKTSKVALVFSYFC